MTHLATADNVDGTCRSSMRVLQEKDEARGQLHIACRSALPRFREPVDTLCVALLESVSASPCGGPRRDGRCLARVGAPSTWPTNAGEFPPRCPTHRRPAAPALTNRAAAERRRRASTATWSRVQRVFRVRN